MHRGQQPLCHRRLGQRQQLGLVQAGLRALRLRIEFADGLNLVAEELDAHRPVVLGRIDVENSAAPRELARHFDQVHLRVAHRGQVAGEHFDVDFFAAPQGDGQAGVVLAVEELERRRLDGRNEDVDSAGGELPQRRSALLLHVRMRREIFKGKHIVGRQTNHARRIDRAGQFAAGLEHRLQRFGGLVVGHDHDDGCLAARAMSGR